MPIILTDEQRNHLFDNILINETELSNYIQQNSFLINNKFKINIDDKIANDIIDLCYERLLKIGFNEDDELNEDGRKIQELINIFNKCLTNYYIQLSKDQNKYESLLNECLDLLGENVTIIKAHKEIDKIFSLFINEVPFYNGLGKVDWEKIEKKVEISEPNGLLKFIHKFVKNPDFEIYIIWYNASYPVVKTSFGNAMRIMSDLSIGSYTWIFCPKSKYIIELDFDKIRIGFM